MHGGNGELFRVHEENGDAVSSLHAQEKAGTVRGGSSASARFGRCGIEKMDDIGMNLFQRDEFEVRRAEGWLEAVAVLENVFSAVPFGKTEIEDFFAFQKADAAGAGAETMDKPGDFRERGDLEDLNGTDFAFEPGFDRGAGVVGFPAVPFLN